MNKEDTKKAIEVMQAYAAGADIEYKFKRVPDKEWRGYSSSLPYGSPSWNHEHVIYRIKPKKPRTGVMMLSVRLLEKYVQGIELTPEVEQAVKNAGIEI